MEFTEATTAGEALDFMKNAQPDSFPDGSVPSFQVGQLLPGDALVLPMATIYLEKAINAHSITLKVFV